MATKFPVPPLFDAVQVGDVEIQMDFASDTARLSAKFAFVNSENGGRFGSGNKNVAWSEATIEKLKGLLLSMEADIVANVCGQEPTTDGGDVVVQTPVDGVPGF